ncbi:MAG: GIY-YIG nuclease family protein [Flavobacteriales bacterium]|nr:GIY-YIG nuclease family protein [Flavobacteriales bacterium]
MERGGSVYIMTNRKNGTLYVGVTSDLIVRVGQHKAKEDPSSFTARYNLHLLVYHESLDGIEEAIAREKQLKAGSRKRKIQLIEAMNPEWRDLYDELIKEEGEALE